MEIILPPNLEGKSLPLPAGVRNLTIIGANGAGKSRFSQFLANSLGSQAFSLSALKAIFANGSPKDAGGTVDELFLKASASPGFLSNEASTMFERLMVMMLNEEISALVKYKVEQTAIASDAHAPKHPGSVTSREREVPTPFPKTKLDTVIACWQEIFPENQVLRQGGHLMFSREGTTDAYAQVRLSAGEKTVLFYFGSLLYAPENGVIFIDSPEMFLHPSIQHRFWDTMESLRPDCRFVYTTHDLDFTTSRSKNALLWVRGYNPGREGWDYNLLPRGEGISDYIYLAIAGARKPMLFIEGDATHSIDSKLYPLVFKNFTVKSLGSCNKVIESTRAFNDLKGLHHLDSSGIIDRDRRDDGEVSYLRGKRIFVPEVAEIENILMLEEVVRAVASYNGRDENRVFNSVKHSVLSKFRHDLRQQALLHTRHRIKRLMERRVDGRFTNINDFEEHLQGLTGELNPRGIYEKLCREFSIYYQTEDYASVLKVYNQKSILPASNVSSLCGLNGSNDAYISAIINILRTNNSASRRISAAIIHCFGLD